MLRQITIQPNPCIGMLRPVDPTQFRTVKIILVLMGWDVAMLSQSNPVLHYIYIYIYSMRELHKAHYASDGNGNETRKHQDECGRSQIKYHELIDAA